MKFTALVSRTSFIALGPQLIARTASFAYRLSLIALWLFFFLLITHNSSLITRQAHAEGEFSTNYDASYNVDRNGLTHVTQQIELVNKTANFYAEQFQLKIGSAKVKDVTANDNTGPLQTDVKFENEVTTITVKFNQKVIGAGKNLVWNLSYTSQELASKSGQIWEISIPRLARSADINNYKAKVSLPRTFGPVAFAAPAPKDQTQSAQTQDFFFERDQLFESGISMSFGEKQVFSFKLEYYLENNSFTPQIQEITLPPDNDYQKIVLEKINPEPVDVVVDADGNFLAKYKLPAKKTVSITAEGFVEVFSKPFRNIYKPLTQAEKEAYIQPQRYWETDSGAIKDKANQLKTPEKIYDFVSTYLKYNQDRLNQPQLERKGAAAAFLAPDDAICMEFTDLFIALARAAGIPAREVEGYAYTQNDRLRPLSLNLSQGDILHAWPEYWDDQRGWIQVDPTWDSTSGGINYFDKLDFNHITFVQKGLSSTDPAPAGAYKKEQDQAKKSVFIEFAKDLPSPTTNPEIQLHSPQTIIAIIPARIGATVKNSGSTTIFSQSVTLSAAKLILAKQSNYEIPLLPPFANRSYTFHTQSKGFFTRGQDTLILSYADVQVSKPVTIAPFYKLFFAPMGLIIPLLIIALALAAFFIHKNLRPQLPR